MMVGLLIANPELLQDIDPARTEAPLPCTSVVSIYGVLDRLTWIEDGFPGAEALTEAHSHRPKRSAAARGAPGSFARRARG